MIDRHKCCWICTQKKPEQTSGRPTCYLNCNIYRVAGVYNWEVEVDDQCNGEKLECAITWNVYGMLNHSHRT